MNPTAWFLKAVPQSEERDAEGRRNIAVLLAYDGTDFLGFQRQAQTPTVQQVVEDGLERLLKHPVRITVAGRTDSGVHACGQVFNFRTGARLPTERVPAALNSVLPPAVVAQSAVAVTPHFSARRSARARVYGYFMATGPFPSPFWRRFAWHYPWPLDVEAMNQAARLLRGRHDFRSFCVEADPQQNTVRRVWGVRCCRRGDVLVTVVRADAFLRGMVRAIVGTLVQVGRGKWAPERVQGILAAKDRSAAGAAAPAHGLCLLRVDY